MNKYVTYGFGNKFIPEKLNIKLGCFLGKPESAWWGSPINAKYGWNKWCRDNYFVPKKDITMDEYLSKDNRIIWTLSDDSKILYINVLEDLLMLRELNYIVSNEFESYTFNFHKIVDDGYSAIQLNDGNIGHYFRLNPVGLELLMHAWDCDSIVVLDPSKIIQLEDNEEEDL